MIFILLILTSCEDEPNIESKEEVTYSGESIDLEYDLRLDDLSIVNALSFEEVEIVSNYRASGWLISLIPANPVGSYLDPGPGWLQIRLPSETEMKDKLETFNVRADTDILRTEVLGGDRFLGHLMQEDGTPHPFLGQLEIIEWSHNESKLEGRIVISVKVQYPPDIDYYRIDGFLDFSLQFN